MAKYTFKCQQCGKICQKYTTESNIKCDCGNDMLRQLPQSSSESQSHEIVDDMLGTKWSDDQPEILKQRRDKYYWQYEVPNLVRSGKYCVQTMCEMGWVIINDKGEVEIQNKPPHER